MTEAVKHGFEAASIAINPSHEKKTDKSQSPFRVKLRHQKTGRHKRQQDSRKMLRSKIFREKEAQA